MRRWWLAGLLVLIAAALSGFYLLFRPVSGPPRDLTLVGDAERGAYLLRLGGCISCHTDAANGGAELAGGAGLATPFGTFVPPNITSDPDTGIGTWTLAQFAEAMSNGRGPHGPLYPVFPYENYTLMSDQEIADLYAALLATEPVATATEAEPPFPFSIRLAAAGWQNLFFTPRRFEPDPDRSETYNRGKYLAFGPAHCVACHTPRNVFGALEWDRALTGSPGGVGGRAPAITAAALRQSGYDVPTLVQTLKDGFTPNFDVLGGPMGEVIADSTSHWNDDDLNALAEFLLAD